MNSWRHNICRNCWNSLHSWLVPEHFRDPSPDFCCFCLRPNSDGIYLRQDPDTTPCHGVHPGKETA